MSFAQVTLLLACLTIAVDAAVLGVAAWWLAARVGIGRAAFDAMGRTVAPAALWLALLVALAATAGSLYLSEVVHLVPCRLCWYQRIAMYPQTLLLLVAALRRDYRVFAYGGALAVAGAVIAAYHYQLERFPNETTLSCGLDVPCSVPVVNRFGFVSVPLMALAAFAAVITLLLIARRYEGEAVNTAVAA